LKACQEKKKSVAYITVQISITYLKHNREQNARRTNPEKMKGLLRRRDPRNNTSHKRKKRGGGSVGPINDTR